MTWLRLRWALLVAWWQSDDEDQCSCDERRASLIYDANGWKRWCGVCLGRVA